METRILPADHKAIEAAAALIQGGELVAFPTETVYGLGANAMDAQAVLKIFEAKGRPADNPLIAHVDTLSGAEALVQHISPMARKLMEAFWPGPLTLVLPARKHIPKVVTAGLSTLGVRMPSHPVARKLIADSGCPIAAPSANASGRPSPTQAMHVFTDLQGRIPLILDDGPCTVGLESTVLDVTAPIPLLLRPGGVTLEMLREQIPETQCSPGVLAPLKEGEAARSPGLKHRHYAPQGKVVLFQGAPDKVRERIQALYDAQRAQGIRTAIICAGQNAQAYGARKIRALGWETTGVPGTQEALSGVARELFAALREMDDQQMESILCECWPDTGVGLAVMNRLQRAAAFRVEEVGH